MSIFAGRLEACRRDVQRPPKAAEGGIFTSLQPTGGGPGETPTMIRCHAGRRAITTALGSALLLAFG
ncbi:MAG: hypothetical protein ABIQ29_05870, partial [Burkholderiaceae bacterium]